MIDPVPKQKLQELSDILALVLPIQLFLHVTAKVIFFKKGKSEHVAPSLKFYDDLKQRQQSLTSVLLSRPSLFQTLLPIVLFIPATLVFLDFFFHYRAFVDAHTALFLI